MKSYHLLPFISGWLYLKVYCNPYFSNEILTSINSQISDNNSPVIKWYFIRYRDDDFHLRIRLHHANSLDAYTSYQTIAPFLNELAEKDMISRVSIETYQPEFFRYGGKDKFYLCEELFCWETKFLIEEGFSHSDALFFKIHNLITNYINLFSLSDKDHFVTQTKKMYENEFGITKGIKKSITSIVVEHQAELGTTILSEDDIQLILNIQSKLNSRDKQRILRSLIHMLVNRAYENAQRKHEAIHYQVLEKLMLISKGKRKKPSD